MLHAMKCTFGLEEQNTESEQKAFFFFYSFLHVCALEKNVGASNSIDAFFSLLSDAFEFPRSPVSNSINVWGIREGLTNSINFHKSSEGDVAV